MRIFFFIFCIIFANQSYSASKKNNIPQKPAVIKAKILIVDKMYSKRFFYETPLNQYFIISEQLTGIATKCIRNSEKQDFIFGKIMRNGEQLFAKWIPVTENAIEPISDKRYDISFVSCNFYEKL